MTARSSGYDPRTWVSPFPSTAYQKPIKNGEVLYRNAVVAVNASGEWVEASADATLVVYGFLRLADADSITGTGTNEIIVDTGCKLLVGSGATQASEGATVYAADDATWSLSSSGGTLPVMGRMMKYVSSTLAYIAIDPMLSIIAATADAADAVSGSGNTPTDEWTNPSAVLTTALKAATTFTTDPQTILAAALTASGGTTALAEFPRNVTFTGGGTTGHCPTSVAITGTDVNDDVLLETLALSSGSGVGVKAFKTIVSFVFTGATSNDGTVACGIGGKLGLTQPAKTRVGVVNVIREYAINAVATSGTYVIAATSPPNGTYAPSSAPDGTRDYALTYEKS